MLELDNLTVTTPWPAGPRRKLTSPMFRGVTTGGASVRRVAAAAATDAAGVAAGVLAAAVPALSRVSNTVFP